MQILYVGGDVEPIEGVEHAVALVGKRHMIVVVGHEEEDLMVLALFAEFDRC